VQMDIEIDERGNGTIKVAGPMRRTMFGPPRLTDLPEECTLIIRNIDLLQRLFNQEEEAFFNRHHNMRPHDDYSCPHPGAMGMMGRSMQGEVLGYLEAMMTHGDVFVIATAQDGENCTELGPALLATVGPLARIAVNNPTKSERYDILEAFSDDHASFKHLDFNEIASLSQGLSRFELVAVCRTAVEEAYRLSLRLSRHQMVDRIVVLEELLGYFEPESPNYQVLEDLIIADFRQELEEDLAQ